MSRRETAYYTLRGGAAVGFVLAATVLPHGLPAALLGMACGVLAILTCIGVNAGGPGEQAGAAAQNRAYDRVRAPQGTWPPYDPGRIVEGSVVPSRPVDG